MSDPIPPPTREALRQATYKAERYESAFLGLLTALGIQLEADCAPAWNEEEGGGPAYRWAHATGTAKIAEMRREIGTLSASAADWRNRYEAEEKRHAETFEAVTRHVVASDLAHPPPNWGDDPTGWVSSEHGWLTPYAYTLPDGADSDQSYCRDEVEARKAWAPAEVSKLIRRLADERRVAEEEELAEAHRQQAALRARVDAAEDCAAQAERKEEAERGRHEATLRQAVDNEIERSRLRRQVEDLLSEPVAGHSELDAVEIQRDQWQAEAAKLTDLVCQLEAKLSAAGSAPAPTVRIEWEADDEGDMLCIYAHHYRMVIATIDSDATGCALRLLRWVGDEAQVIKALDKAEAVKLITFHLSLRGITVPPYPEQT